MHRDPRFWHEPDRFDPSRFTPEGKATRPKFTYFPFGAGPRICIGESFAWMEGVLMLATLAQRWRMELLSRDVKSQASITLRPKGGIRVRIGAVGGIDKVVSSQLAKDNAVATSSTSTIVSRLQ